MKVTQLKKTINMKRIKDYSTKLNIFTFHYPISCDYDTPYPWCTIGPNFKKLDNEKYLTEDQIKTMALEDYALVKEEIEEALKYEKEMREKYDE